MTYFRFFQSSPRILSFGVLLTLFSSFGQTFLISVFVPNLLEGFALDTARFGVLYAGATLLSAASLPYFGGFLDRVSLRRFSLAVGLGLSLSCLAMAYAANVPMLFLAVLGLRLSGQGLLTLTASTTMARAFEFGRGKALSLSSLGYPLGEGLLPLAVVMLIHGVGWRLSWAILGGAIALVLLPAIHYLLRDLEEPRDTISTSSRPSGPNLSLLRDWRFYLLMPGNMYLPLVLTALFLYQVPLAESHGWTAQTMATAFMGFAAARVAGSLLIGPWIDRWGALRLFPVILVPVSAGLVALSIGSSPWIALVYLALTGVSLGISMPMMTALWAEIFGVESLGATKGTVATAGVFATALGPVVLGGLLKVGVPFSAIVPGCAALGLLTTGISLVARRRLGEASITIPGGDRQCETI